MAHSNESGERRPPRRDSSGHVPRPRAPGLSSESGELELLTDAIDVLAMELTACTTALDPEARNFFKKLLEHSCRKCCHLVLVHPVDASGQRLPYGPLSAMPTPACRAMPEWSHDPLTGETAARFRETWKRCPLHGVRRITDLITALEHQIGTLNTRCAQLEQQLQQLRRDHERLSKPPGR